MDLLTHSAVYAKFDGSFLHISLDTEFNVIN